MASIFDLQILNENKYNKYNFVVNETLNKRGTKNKKKQFANRKDLESFLRTVETLFGHCRYVKNHIMRYCNNPRFKKSVEEYQNVIIMLSFADLKFNQRCNLFKNLKYFHHLFNDIQYSSNKGGKKPDVMKKDYDRLVEITKKCNKLTQDDCQKKINPNLTRPFLEKLSVAVENIVMCYNKTHQELSQSDHSNTASKQFLNKLKPDMKTDNKQNAILYYAFAINYKNISDFHSLMKDLIKILDETGLFNEK
jgi:hypothetical protein